MADLSASWEEPAVATHGHRSSVDASTEYQGLLVDTTDTSVSSDTNGRSPGSDTHESTLRTSEVTALEPAPSKVAPGVATLNSAAVNTLAADPIFETRIATAADDIEEKSSGTISANINDLDMGYDGTTRQTVGLRFTGIDVPRGAVITNAYIQFTSDEVGAGAASFLIRGEDADDSAAFTAIKFDVSSRPTTDASVAWTPASWTVRGEAGIAERTPDLKAIVQEIIDRGGWAALNDMAFTLIGTGTRVAKSYEGSAAGAALLHIEYTVPVAGSPVTFNTPADGDPATNQIAELATAGTRIGVTASASDPDAGDTVSYSLNDSRFAIDSNGIITRSGTGTLDFETQASITLTVTATSSDQSTAIQTFTIGVLNSQEPVAFNTPADTDAATNQIAELAAAGTVVGITASASDPDAGDTISYSLNDQRFAIDSNGVITRSGTGTLDFETQASITLTVTATSSDQSTATQTFTIGVLNSQEPVAFNTPADADTATNQIAQNAVAGTKVGITASASDPDAGDTVSYSLNDSRFAIDANGVITRSGTGTLNAQSQPSISLTVTATSSDGGTASETFNLNVTSGTNGPPISATLVHTVLTSQWSPASPDPSGITYISHLGTLFVSDGEVDEMSIFQGKNLFETSLNGTLVRSLTTISFSDEPSGVAYNPTNHHLYFTDDTGTKSVYELNPGMDGLYNTSDDIVTSFKTSAFGSTDPEGLSYDTNRGVLYLANGVNNTVYTINPGVNGKFDGVPSVGGDDVVTSFAMGATSNGDPCVEYDPVHDLLYIVKSRTEVTMTTPTGEFLGTLDISAAHARKVAGLALAPSSDDPNQMSLYIVDRGVDNDVNPNENDGKMYEFRLDHWLLS
ncbi:RTX toxin [Ensifer sp. B1-9]|uniref:RTX toxin n=1 Tax=Ensifer sp. B1-9 TaxID=3141455 RepID=UPI003D25FEFC